MTGKKGGQKRGISSENVESLPVIVINKPSGPTSDSQAKKTQSVDKIMGIKAL